MPAEIHADWGLWHDFNRKLFDRSQILATDLWSRVLTSTVAVSITLASPYIFELIVWLIRVAVASVERFNNWRKHYYQLNDSDPVNGETGTFSTTYGTVGDGPQSNEEGNNESADNGSAQGAQQQAPQFAHNARETVWGFVKSIPHGEIKRLSNAWFMASVTVILFIVFIVQAIAGALSANIASDSTGLVSSKDCGIWEFNPNTGSEAADLDDLDNQRKEARAAQYAKTCYGSAGKSGPLSCRLFYKQNIPFTTQHRQQCPFGLPDDEEMCLSGPYSSVTFETGLVDASVIGINAWPTHKFKRSTTCTPLNVSSKFIVKVPEADETRYRYYYGAKDGTNATFETVGDPFEWLVPVYSVEYGVSTRNWKSKLITKAHISLHFTPMKIIGTQ